MERADVIVVGAGLSGLACAFQLASSGRRVAATSTAPGHEQLRPAQATAIAVAFTYARGDTAVSTA